MISKKKLKSCYIKIPALQCLVCGDIVYSRANHDCRFCSCSEVMVDAGPGYGRAAGDMDKCKAVIVKLRTTIEGLEKDWELGKDKFGLIKGKNALQRLKERYETKV